MVSWRDEHPDEPVIGIDVPVGLPPRVAFRACDQEARVILGERRACVFQPPDRELFRLPYPDVQAEIARRRESEPEARGLSKQGHGIIGKIEEVDDLILQGRDREKWLAEVHPEVSFRTLTGKTMPSKKRLIGRNARLRALTTVFPDIKQRYDEKLWLRREVGRDDILDAYAGLWSACRLARPSAKHLELGGGERDGRGVLMRIIV